MSDSKNERSLEVQRKNINEWLKLEESKRIDSAARLITAYAKKIIKILILAVVIAAPYFYFIVLYFPKYGKEKWFEILFYLIVIFLGIAIGIILYSALNMLYNVIEITYLKLFYYNRMKKKIFKYRNRECNFEKILSQDSANNVEQIIKYMTEKISPKKFNKSLFKDYLKKDSTYSFARKQLLLKFIDERFDYEELVLINEDLQQTSFFETAYLNVFKLFTRLVSLLGTLKIIVASVVSTEKYNLKSNFDLNVDAFLTTILTFISKYQTLVLVSYIFLIIIIEVVLLSLIEGWKMRNKKKKLMIILNSAIRKKEFKGSKRDNSQK